MALSGCSPTPAGQWRAFFVCAILAVRLTGAPPANTGTGAPSPYLQAGQPDQAEGKKALDQLRRQGIQGNYFLEFQLRVMPRRGEERTFAGVLWGGQNALGAVTRVQLASGTADAKCLLIQNGPQPAAWQITGGGTRAELIDGDALFAPLATGTDITAFDLQMPFIHWPDFVYEGLTRFRGRPAHIFLLRPPAAFAEKNSGLRGVRLQLDSQFNALVQVELLGARDRVTKTTSLVDLKKVGEQWIVKTIDVRDETTRNKTRLSVTGAALGLEFSGVLFESERLAEDIAPPPAARVAKIAP